MPVVLSVELGGLSGMVRGMVMMAIGNMGVMRGCLVITSVMVFGGQVVMPCCMLVVFGCFAMVLGCFL